MCKLSAIYAFTIILHYIQYIKNLDQLPSVVVILNRDTGLDNYTPISLREMKHLGVK